VDHSRHVAQAARILAQAMRLGDPRHADLDPQRAYILGLLHDIGRREGVHGMRHVLDGYRHMEAQGYPAVGRICLTHSYPNQALVMGASGWDGEPEGLAFVQEYIAAIEYDPYDRLAQLGDAICMPHGWVLLEKRIVNVALRYGLNSDRPVRILALRWQAYFEIKRQVEGSIGGSIYDHLPGVVENTFF
jgi:hypothetical protein